MNRAAQSRAIVRDRLALEAPGIRAASSVGLAVRVAVLRAYRGGHDWRGAVRRGMAPMRTVLAEGMALADLTGRWRSRTIAESVSIRAARPVSVYGSALETIRRRLAMTDAELESLVDAYGREAAMVVGDVGSVLEGKVAAAVERAVSEGLHTRGGVALIREAFDAAGVTPRNSYTLEAVYRTQTGQAYESGRWDVLNDPDVSDLIWGYEYSAVGDDRTTDTCQQLDGMRLAKDNPAWSRLRPLNHWGCRSTLLTVFEGDPSAVETPIPLVDPEPGFEFKALPAMVQLSRRPA